MSLPSPEHGGLRAITPDTALGIDRGPNKPLHQLQLMAPEFDAGLPLTDVIYSMSNDELVASLRLAHSRVETPEYQDASNPVAVIVGEGAGFAALPYIPEGIIVFLDKLEPMCAHLSRYWDTSRQAPGPRGWLDRMGPPYMQGRSAEQRLLKRLIKQVVEWNSSDERHPLDESGDPSIFARNQQLAREKEIIIWRGDITNPDDMRHLGDSLRACDATVTFFNGTNVMPCSETITHAAQFAELLRLLPMTPNAPILTTTRTRRNKPGDPGHGYISVATGPFWGPDHLAAEGGRTGGELDDDAHRTAKDLGPVSRRQINPGDALPLPAQRSTGK